MNRLHEEVLRARYLDHIPGHVCIDRHEECGARGSQLALDRRFVDNWVGKKCVAECDDSCPAVPDPTETYECGSWQEIYCKVVVDPMKARNDQRRRIKGLWIFFFLVRSCQRDICQKEVPCCAIIFMYHFDALSSVDVMQVDNDLSVPQSSLSRFARSTPKLFAPMGSQQL